MRRFSVDVDILKQMILAILRSRIEMEKRPGSKRG